MKSKLAIGLGCMLAFAAVPASCSEYDEYYRFSDYFSFFDAWHSMYDYYYYEVPECSTTNEDAPTPGDGMCDPECNSADFNWDGGDCCENTCKDGRFDCGKLSPYNCHTRANFDQYDTWHDGGCHEDAQYGPVPGDGWCDPACNSEEFNWDGGDCCIDTCQSDSFDCGPFFNCHTDSNFEQFPAETFGWLEQFDYEETYGMDDIDNKINSKTGDSTHSPDPVHRNHPSTSSEAGNSLLPLLGGAVIGMSLLGAVYLGKQWYNERSRKSSPAKFSMPLAHDDDDDN